MAYLFIHAGNFYHALPTYLKIGASLEAPVFLILKENFLTTDCTDCTE